MVELAHFGAGGAREHRRPFGLACHQSHVVSLLQLPHGPLPASAHLPAHPAIEPVGPMERPHKAVAVELAGILPADPPHVVDLRCRKGLVAPGRPSTCMAA